MTFAVVLFPPAYTLAHTHKIISCKNVFLSQNMELGYHSVLCLLAMSAVLVSVPRAT